MCQSAYEYVLLFRFPCVLCVTLGVFVSGTMDQFMPHCDTGFTKDKFITVTKALVQELSTNPSALVR